MDKNNDIQVNKVDKWCAGVADVSLWQAKKSVDIFLCGYSSMLSIEALDAVRTIYVALDEALDRFNELEARHQKDTGMISEYEEENKKLHLNISNANAFYKKLQTEYCDIIEMDLNQRYHKRFNDLKSKLETKDKECSELRESNELCMKAHLRLIDESAELVTENTKLKEENAYLKDKCEKLKETNKSYPVACECENFKPKVHHSYDPLDDLPDVEHS